eukprot:CAMPEP_0184856030 /NCGR_PEP_ID=MMETSP0580-20130426/1187_1 /TAXON_ID=1118495 /ORGANISM="Dactyliosolen fragilissimus" /LENGTH=1243 /DNA_ID=CAMNT_0027350795 /DNA_START=75 /DNA_END=3803 /DNA_ORIENTATION=-
MRFLALFYILNYLGAEAAFDQGSEIDYYAKYNEIVAASYSAVDDLDSSVNPNAPPSSLIQNCKNGGQLPSPVPTVEISSPLFHTIKSSSLMAQCGSASICVIPEGITVEMNTDVNIGALIVRGSLKWTDETQNHSSSSSSSTSSQYLCAGYIVMEGSGSFEMNLQQGSGWIYLKNNDAVHPVLRSRAFGAYGTVLNGLNSNSSNPRVDISGRDMVRTWSLLSDPLAVGDTTLSLLHNPHLMGWRVGDRVGIAPTKEQSTGYAQTFRIIAMSSSSNKITLSRPSSHDHDAEFVPPHNSANHPKVAAIMSAEVVNLTRNIVITGDDYEQVNCVNGLPEAVMGEETSVLGCRCSSFRTRCTVGLHTAHMHGGVTRIQNTRIEKCGQRGIEGKYCLHFHQMKNCPECLYKNNAVENSHQRGIIVHGTHLSSVEENVLYDVRGAGVYIEDGNEMWNNFKYNVIICPYPFNHPSLHGCTVPGTSNRIADTRDNQSAIFSLAATNNLIGNRAANSFNGMLIKGGGSGRGSAFDNVCASDAKFGILQGNTFHGHGRFGTYSLFWNYPKVTDQSPLTNGYNVDKSLCEGFDSNGNTRGFPVSITNNFDYDNTFVGHYEAGDIQYNGHHSFNNLNLIYWKETKNFENGCSAHLTGGHYVQGNMALPDQGTFIIENTVFGDSVSLEPNHHCNVGNTGVLCMPQYILHKVKWNNANHARKWVTFQSHNTQGHGANQMHGGIFSLSPHDASIVMQGGKVEHSFFPEGYVSLVSNKFTHLLSAPNDLCIQSSSLGSNYGFIYDDGILCKVPLRSLKVYSRDLISHSAPSMKFRVWYNSDDLGGQNGAADAEQIIGFHQTGGDNSTRKQGFSVPLIPGKDKSYSLSLTTSDGNIPTDWVIEFSDNVVGNRFEIEYIYLTVQGRTCGSNGLISSQHDRKFIWSGDEFMDNSSWGKHGACVGIGPQPDDVSMIDCSISEGLINPVDCQGMCTSSCNNENSYCNCGTKTCHCKPGFAGNDCTIDLCAAARCGEHGTCSALYLGASSSLPVTSNNACICDEGWSGPLCDVNPCLKDGVVRNCSGNGKCVASGDADSICLCDPGFSGIDCETSCEGYCNGNYPFGCATNVAGKIEYGCNQNNGCHYLGSGEQYPNDQFCTYKSEVKSLCKCESLKDCEIIGPCNSDGSCPRPEQIEDGTPCNSVPWGICERGICISNNSQPTISPSTDRGQRPTSSPSKIPTNSPTSNLFPCGCKLCTSEVLN